MSDYLILENLPNEIFHELFEYFDIYELYRIFARLNARIDSVIESFRFLQIILNAPTDIDQPINRYFLPKINTLIVNHSKQFFNTIETICSPIRSLILCQPSRDQWNSIRPAYFPSLQRLYLINSVFVYRTEQLCQLIFSNEFPSLRTCSLPFVSYEENNQWTCSPTLQSLRINLWDIRVYKQILETCPNLIRLKVEITGGTNQEQLTCIDVDRKHSILQYLSLRSAKSITCELIDSMLFLVPNLAQFLLHVKDQRPSYVPKNQLASILQDRTPKLSHLMIDITISESLYDEERLNTNYPLFQSCRVQPDLPRPSRLMIFGSI